jgi:predicted small secreted protein
MHLKKFLPLIFLILLVCASGCETAKGFKQDAKNTWSHLQNVDDWVKKNLW